MLKEAHELLDTLLDAISFDRERRQAGHNDGKFQLEKAYEAAEEWVDSHDFN